MKFLANIIGSLFTILGLIVIVFLVMMATVDQKRAEENRLEVRVILTEKHEATKRAINHGYAEYHSKSGNVI